MNRKGLEERKIDLKSQMTALLDTAKVEKRAMTETETKKFDEIEKEIREINETIEKKKKTMAADKIGVHPLNINTTTNTNHPPIIKTKTNTNINHRLITHTSSSSTSNNIGSKSERSSKIQKKIQHNTQLISEMMKLNNK